MLVVETVARIRREFFVKSKSIKEIVRDLGVSRNTVRKVLRSGRRRLHTSAACNRCRSWDRGRPSWKPCWRRTGTRRGASG